MCTQNYIYILTIQTVSVGSIKKLYLNNMTIRPSAMELYHYTPFFSINFSLALPWLTGLYSDIQDKKDFNNLWRLAWVRLSGYKHILA